MPHAGAERVLAALVDIEQEERVAEARATAEMIHILGHELLNGLAPIVSLAESGLAAVEMPETDQLVLHEILGTLARRAEGLLRFTEAYRELARLPEPIRRTVSVHELIKDLERLFVGKWPDVELSVEVPEALSWLLDRDQIYQAIWALLQNAVDAIATAKTDKEGAVALCGFVTRDGLTIEVRDNANGLMDETTDHFFRPFHTTKPSGTGIGLSLARQIANAHGGILTLQSRSPTTFRLQMPTTRQRNSR